MTLRVGALVLLAAAAGCGANEREASGPVDRCVDRLLSRADPGAAKDDRARAYARTTYCEPFARNGWVDADGVLSIAAQRWSDRSGTCEFGSEGQPTRTVPCEELRRTDAILDCALLHHVRRREVRAYLQEVDRPPNLRCDDGTPLDKLGVP